MAGANPRPVLLGSERRGELLGKAAESAAAEAALAAKRARGAAHPPGGEWELRCRLAAAYRVAAHCGWDQLIFNHITVKVPGSEALPNGPHFLLNPFGLRFDEVTASSLIRVAIDGEVLDKGSATGLLFKEGFVVHSAVHLARGDAQCVWHCHHEDTAAVSMLKCGLLPLSQEAMHFAGGRLSYHPFEGSAVDLAERERMARSLGPSNTAMLLENHGPLVLGASVEEAFFQMFRLTRACSYQVKALAAAGGDLSKVHVPGGELLEGMKARASQAMAQAGDALDTRMEKYDRARLAFDAARRLAEKLHGAEAIYC